MLPSTTLCLSDPSLLLLPGPLWHGVVVPDDDDDDDEDDAVWTQMSIENVSSFTLLFETKLCSGVSMWCNG